MRGALIAVALALALGLGSFGCARAWDSTRQPHVEAPTLEQLYMARRYGEVVAAATRVIEAEDDDVARERVAEARFFRALAWLAGDLEGKQASALLELRTLEFEHSDVIWGRVAALYVAEAARVDALQATLLDVVLEQHELRGQVEDLEQRLAGLEAELAGRDVEIAGLERERHELLEQLEVAREQATKTTERLRELEEELAGLKQIDMQREP